MMKDITMDQEEYYQKMKEEYAEKVDTPKPCSVGDRVEVTQISGVPWDDKYPMYGTVKRVEPRGVGTHNIFADWFVRVRFTEEECNGAVYKGTTELFCVGGSRREWNELPIKVIEEEE